MSRHENGEPDPAAIRRAKVHSLPHPRRSCEINERDIETLVETLRIETKKKSGQRTSQEEGRNGLSNAISMTLVDKDNFVNRKDRRSG